MALGTEGQSPPGCRDAWEGMGRPEVAVGRKGAASPCKADNA